jgi:hypothetical protein
MRAVGRWSHLTTLIVVPAVIACSETTSPEKATEPPASIDEVRRSAPSTELQKIGATLVDATDWVLVAIVNDNARLAIKDTLKELADDLVANRNQNAKADVAALRSMLVSLSSLGPAIGPIEVALDQIDSEFSKL